MATIEQGDLLKINGIRYPMLVVSNSFFNQSGTVITNIPLPAFLKG